ncbi:MAG: hypothetical protein QXH24_02655 [Candidatus Bathyarchaeia archaeon]
MKTSDYALPLVVQHLFGSIGLAAFACVILAACMSTADGLLLSSSAIITRDVISKIRLFTPRKEIWIGRIFIIVLGILAMLFNVWAVPELYTVAAVAVQASISAFLFPMILGLY